MKNEKENTMQTSEIIFSAQFELGADILRAGKKIYRVPSCTHWDDDHIRVIVDRNREAVVQSERGIRTDEWSDICSLGPVKGLEVVEDHPRGCCCDDCY